MQTSTETDVLKATSPLIEQWLDTGVDWSTLPDNLRQASRYSVLAGGKRLRPSLVIHACRAVGGEDDHAMHAAGAIELVHCFSLVHDDLPALDDDDLRRGRPTLHVHAGEAMAILAGDLMLTMAFGELARARTSQDVRSSLVAELATGTTNMVIGQVYDTLGGLPQDEQPIERVRRVHRNKTGALIRAACRMGALCGDADPRAFEAMTTYGEAMGLMFQIVDDVLDVTQTAEHMGKATGKDATAGKTTYPAFLGLDDCRREVEALRQTSVEAVAPLGNLAAPLAAIAESMAIRTR